MTGILNVEQKVFITGIHPASSASAMNQVGFTLSDSLTATTIPCDAPGKGFSAFSPGKIEINVVLELS